MIRAGGEDEKLVDLDGLDRESGDLQPAGLAHQWFDHADLGRMVRVIEGDLGNGQTAGDGALDETMGQGMVRTVEVLVGFLGRLPVEVIPALADARRGVAAVKETRHLRVELGLSVEFDTRQIEQPTFPLGQAFECFLPADLETRPHVLVEVLHERLARRRQAGLNLGVQLGLEGVERGLYLCVRAAGLVHVGNAALDVHAGFQCPENLVRRAKDTVKEPELLTEEFVHALVGLVAAVQEVDHDHVVLLAVPMAAADALLDPLGIPRQIEVDDQRAELEVDALGGRLRSDQDRGAVAEMLDNGSLHVHGARAGEPIRSLVLGLPSLVDVGVMGLVVRPVDRGDLALIPVGTQQIVEVGLGLA